jgi:hypothetical protein
MTRVFKTKKELAERLMAGEKWGVVCEGHDTVRYCYYDEKATNPFRISNGDEMGNIWGACNSNYQWEQVIDKPKTKTVWFWKIKDIYGYWSKYNNMCTEEYLKELSYVVEYKRLDILGSEEVEV